MVNRSRAEYTAHIGAAASEAANEDKIPPSDAEDNCDDEDSCFTTVTVDSCVSGVICG